LGPVHEMLQEIIDLHVGFWDTPKKP